MPPKRSSQPARGASVNRVGRPNVPDALVTPGALTALHDAKRVILICHASPDSDCVGGMMALTHVLRAMGKQAFPLSPDPIPDYLHHVPGSSEVPGAPK